jgi:recombination protein RecT
MNNLQPAAGQQTLQGYLNNAYARKKFDQVLDKGANGFITSLLSLVNSTPQLQKADPATVMSAAMTAATLKLPINPSLGLAYIVPYKGQAQFQMGWKGFVQLAERSAQYRTINSGVVYEGQIEDIDFITGEIIRGKKVSDTVIGYVAYIELSNGFKKTFYMTKEEMERHARKFSQSYQADIKYSKDASIWSKNFDVMAKKTVLKLLISKYGIMSIDMQSSDMATAIASDQAVIHKVGEEYEYPDNNGNETQESLQEPQEDTGSKTIEHEAPPVPDNIDPETGEILHQRQEDEFALS